jgi:hypothetical protein
MTAFMHDLAGASLPVAIALLALAASARAVLWAQIDHAPARRIAAQYLEPLSTWGLVAVGVHTLAVGAAGDAGVGSLALALVLGVAAVVLRSAGERGERVAARPERRAAARAPEPAPAAAATAPAAATSAPAPESGASLWAEPVDDETTRRAGLWSRG